VAVAALVVAAVVVSVAILCICYSRCYTITSSYMHAVFSPEICLRGCIMRFITFKSPVKPCPVKYFKWFAKGNQGKGEWQRAHFVLDQTTKGTLEAQRAQYPLVEA